MAYAFVQKGFLNNTTGTQAAGTASSITVTAGNALIVAIFTTTTGAQTVSGNGNTYSFKGSSAASAGCFLSFYTVQNANGGATAVATTDTGCFDIFVGEYSGLATSGSIPAPVFNNQAPGATGANILTSGALSVTAPAMAFAFTCDVNAISGGGAGATGTMTAGNTLAWTGRVTSWVDTTPTVTGIAEDLQINGTGNVTATFGITGNKQFNSFITGIIALPEPASGQTGPGAIQSPGPGVSPSARDQFHVPIRDSSSPNNKLTGFITSVSTNYGSAIALGGMLGQSYSTTIDYGQMVGAGGMPGNLYSVSIDYGVLSQSGVLIGNIPGGGPGISPSSLFQFSTFALDETLNIALIQGQIIGNASTNYGKLTGTGGLSGQSYSVSTIFNINNFVSVSGQSYNVSISYGAPGNRAQLTGLSGSISISYGAIQALTLSSISGVSYSVSSEYGALSSQILTGLSGVSYGVSIEYGSMIPLSGPVMPNVVGMIIQEALAVLQVAGVLVPSQIGYFGTYPVTIKFIPTSSPTNINATYIGDFGVVHAQSIAAGLAVKANTPITLICSDFPTNVTFP